jgi:DNA-binding beta-propeller fold protein YncE
MPALPTVARLSRFVLAGAGLLALLIGFHLRSQSAGSPQPAKASSDDRSPVDLILGPDGSWMATVNQSSHSVSLVDLESGKIRAETECGKRPSAIAMSPDGTQLLVTGTFSGDLTFLAVEDGTLKKTGQLYLGFEPRGVVMSGDGKLAYVALTTGHSVAVIDVAGKKLVEKIDVGHWPRYLALSPDGKRLAVGNNGDGGVAIIDTATRKKLYADEFAGLNFGQMQITADSKYAYVPWMVYRHNPITQSNIRLGWVLASRIARVKLDGLARREAISLDPPGLAVADPHGLALSPDEQWLVCAASGTHELLVYRIDGLPFKDYGGTDHIDPALLKDTDRFRRIPLGGRPMAVRFSKDGQKVFVANYLLNAIQVVDLAGNKVEKTYDLGSAAEVSLARRGEAIFYDGKRSLDQWYSCHSCHYEGHTNSVTVDTKNDGRFGNFKTVLSLRNVANTGPYFWHGWQKDLDSALKGSMTDTMLVKAPGADDVKAMRAFLETLSHPANPNRTRDGKLSEQAQRGEKVFRSDKASCSRCHSGPYFTDGRIHEVGTADRTDVYKGYNPPSLLGIYDRILYMHDGRARSLEEVLQKHHNPNNVTGRGELTEDETSDLLAYLRSL